MLLDELCNTDPTGTIPVPDSSYDWSSFEEHVSHLEDLNSYSFWVL